MYRRENGKNTKETDQAEQYSWNITVPQKNVPQKQKTKIKQTCCFLLLCFLSVIGLFLALQKIRMAEKKTAENRKEQVGVGNTYVQNRANQFRLEQVRWKQMGIDLTRKHYNRQKGLEQSKKTEQIPKKQVTIEQDVLG